MTDAPKSTPLDHVVWYFGRGLKYEDADGKVYGFHEPYAFCDVYFTDNSVASSYVFMVGEAKMEKEKKANALMLTVAAALEMRGLFNMAERNRLIWFCIEGLEPALKNAKGKEEGCIEYHLGKEPETTSFTGDFS